MKKIVLLTLALFLCLGIYSCEKADEQINKSPEETKKNEVVENIKSEEPKEVELTVDNIHEYLIISTEFSDLIEYDSEYKQDDGKLKVKTSPKKRGDFNDVTLEVSFTSSSTGWASEGKVRLDRDKTLTIPFDGKFEETFRVSSDFARVKSSNPKFEITINNVSGTFLLP